ncbi:MAG: benzoyl-CoA reductase subunit D [Acidobacteria bacterium]|nr:benzoyl-CoA reductase subunit D [Acidobacteriota bacterium]
MNRTDVYTMGVDVGASSVKTVLMSYGSGEHPEILFKDCRRMRRRNPSVVADESMEDALSVAGLELKDIAYVASTGEGEMVKRKRGHFYSMTTHAKGAAFLVPAARAVLDLGALHARAMKINDEARVLSYRMTGQCASGSGQFIENITRYLGVSLSEVGALSLQSDHPERASSICAVLAETDVINMVSRGVSTPDIIRGIHESIAQRLVKLLSALKADSPLVLTGGLSRDAGMVEVIRRKVAEDDLGLTVLTHPDAIYAGALGAALWAGWRHFKLQEKASAAS